MANLTQSRFANLIYYLDLIIILTFKEIKVKYRSNILGYLWSVLHPLSMAVVLYFAFKFVMKIPIENFTLFLITGLFPWQWFSNSVASSSVSLLANASLIKKVNFPRYFIPLSNVLNDAFHFLLSIPVIIAFAFYYNIFPTLDWLYGIPLFMLSQFMITYGISLMVSSINLFFRDLERLITIGLSILFYLTPVAYSAKLIPEKFKNYLFFNPMFATIEGWHKLFLEGSFDMQYFIVSFFYGAILLVMGLWIFSKLSYKFAEVL